MTENEEFAKVWLRWVERMKAGEQPMPLVGFDIYDNGPQPAPRQRSIIPLYGAIIAICLVGLGLDGVDTVAWWIHASGAIAFSLGIACEGVQMMRRARR